MAMYTSNYAMIIITTNECTLQLPEVHIFIGILWFVQYIWEKLRPHTKLVSIFYQLFCSSKKAVCLSSKCSLKVVLNDGIHFKAISWRTSELTAPEACHL